MDEPVDLLTGVEACYAGGESPTIAGRLLADPDYGTTMNDRPIMWPVGFTGVRETGGEVAVLNRAGKVVAMTGKRYALSPAPVPAGDAGRLLHKINAFAAAGDCYPWDLVEIPASP